MGFTDKTLQCSDCGTTFSFTAVEQEFYASKGYVNEPKRCPACRKTRKAQRSGSGFGGYRASNPDRQMYRAVCAECGKECEVPFEPREGKPVYCSECYKKMRMGSQL